MKSIQMKTILCKRGLMRYKLTWVMFSLWCTFEKSTKFNEISFNSVCFPGKLKSLLTVLQNLKTMAKEYDYDPHIRR